VITTHLYKTKRGGSDINSLPDSLKHGHTFGADTWGIGIIIYAMLYGRCPFEGKSNEKKHSVDLTYKNIMYEDVQFDHSAPVSRDARSLIRGLLIKNPDDRMTLDEALKHDWFNSSKGNWTPECIQPCLLFDIPSFATTEYIEYIDRLNRESVHAKRRRGLSNREEARHHQEREREAERRRAAEREVERQRENAANQAYRLQRERERERELERQRELQLNRRQQVYEERGYPMYGEDQRERERDPRAMVQKQREREREQRRAEEQRQYGRRATDDVYARRQMVERERARGRETLARSTPIYTPPKGCLHLISWVDYTNNGYIDINRESTWYHTDELKSPDFPNQDLRRKVPIVRKLLKDWDTVY
ncbi:hypothetical protein KIPB_003904, partial [Kipferlia bialata]